MLKLLFKVNKILWNYYIRSLGYHHHHHCHGKAAPRRLSHGPGERWPQMTDSTMINFKNGKLVSSWRAAVTSLWQDGGGRSHQAGSGGLQVALAIERRREGHIVEGGPWGIGSGVWLHALDAVLCLVWWQFPLQLLRQDVRLREQQVLESNYIISVLYLSLILKNFTGGLKGNERREEHKKGKRQHKRVRWQ